jgi:NADH-quinone oxidoreductase subunit K
MPIDSVSLIWFNYFIPAVYPLFFSNWIFFLGLSGLVFTHNTNLIRYFVSLEIMFFGISLNFIFFSIYFQSPAGQIYALVMIAISASEAALGLGLLVAAFKLDRSISFTNFSYLNG